METVESSGKFAEAKTAIPSRVKLNADKKLNLEEHRGSSLFSVGK
jgi:hypothetical protein